MSLLPATVFIILGYMMLVKGNYLIAGLFYGLSAFCFAIALFDRYTLK